MFGTLLLIFIGIPFLEMLILIKMGEMFGFWATLTLVVVTGVVGATFARIEGLRAWNNVQKALNAGEMPGEHAVDAFLILIAGFLLITPGLLTDLVGLLLLIPWTRYGIKRWLRIKFDEMLRRARERGGQADIRFFLNE
ncbi:MAG TPA: FxsA family protein [bacterium]|nr:FxsA family protein [bacterium]